MAPNLVTKWLRIWWQVGVKMALNMALAFEIPSSMAMNLMEALEISCQESKLFSQVTCLILQMKY